MKRMAIASLMVFLLLCSFGCHTKPAEDFFTGEGLLSLEEIEKYVSLFEKDLTVFKEETGLSDDDITKHERYPGLYHTSVNRTFSEQTFALQLLTDATVNPETLWGYQYFLTFEETDDPKAFEIAADIAVKARDLYGEPDTYPIAPGRIFTEDGELIEGGSNEVWEVMENIEFQINVHSAYEQGGAAIELRYRIRNPRLSRNSDYPKNS